jgi:hypothetical protein
MLNAFDVLNSGIVLESDSSFCCRWSFRHTALAEPSVDEKSECAYNIFNLVGHHVGAWISFCHPLPRRAHQMDFA